MKTQAHASDPQTRSKARSKSRSAPRSATARALTPAQALLRSPLLSRAQVALPDPQALFQQGFELHKQGQLAQAQAIYLKVLAQQPEHFDALHLSGVILAQLGDPAGAEATIARAIAINPTHASAWSNRGNSLQELQRAAEALACYDRAIELNPRYAEAYRNRGDARWAQDRQTEAADDYEKALAADPSFLNAWLKLGDMCKKLQRWLRARECYQRYIDAYPEHWMAHFNLGFVQIQLNDAHGAEASFRTVLQFQPNHADAHGNLGIALQKNRQLQAALDSYERAILHNPNHADAYSNRGLLLQELNRTDEAMACYNRALDIKPDFANAWWNKSLSLLLMGDFENGWPMYEWRWRSVQLATDRPWKTPRWDGQQSLQGKTVFLFAEQGFGDTLQFARYALNIKALGAARVILEVQNPLVNLLRAMPGLDEVIGQGAVIPPHDVQCPLMSLPWLLQTRIDTMPAPIPYLRVDAGLRDIWRKHLGPKTRPRIGIAWSGRATHNNDHHRSLALARMLPLLSDPFEWISLQKEVREADQPVLARAGIRSFAEHLHDFADTAALLEQLDLVISVDTSVVHLAGALGKPVWVMLPEVPDWRWLMGREDTPWYPTLRLYRQGADKNYDPVLARIRTDLAHDAPTVTEPGVTEPAVTEAAPPSDATGWFRQGHALHQRGDITGAAQRYQQALALDARHFDALHLLGVCQAQQGDNAAAADTLAQALQINDQVASLWSNLGNVQSGLKRMAEAIASYQKAIALDPRHLQAWFNMGCGHKDLKQHDQALHAFEQALRLQPDYAEALSSKAQVLRDLKRYDDALADYDRLTQMQPRQERHHSNRGLVLSDLGRTDEALQCFDQALAIHPRYAGAHYNRALSLQRINQLDAAIAGYDRAIDCDPNLIDAHWNRALTLLLAGRLEQGWPAYEWRWKKPEVQALIRHDPSQAWLGQGGLAQVRGKTLLLHAEQGLGDTLQFCRYATLLAQQGAQVILEVQPELRSLLARSLPGLNVIAQGEPVPPHDHHTPLMSLPLVFQTTLETIPAPGPYLQADPERMARWQERLGPRSRQRVGIVYSGRAQHNGDAKRSIALAKMWALLPQGIELISLQRDVRESDRPALLASGIAHHGDALNDFDDTAALCACLDAVICVDTSVAHLAAALGLPTHVLIPRVPDWRWMLDREDSPWYPTMRLHRQRMAQAWPDIQL